MELLNWSEKYSVNHNILDQQHQQLFEIVNELYNSFTNRDSHIIIREIISKLHYYAVFHFAEEEKILHKRNVPLKNHHIKQHNDFIKLIAALQNKFDLGDRNGSVQLIGHLKRNLMNHILNDDKKYAHLFVHQHVKNI